MRKNKQGLDSQHQKTLSDFAVQQQLSSGEVALGFVCWREWDSTPHLLLDSVKPYHLCRHGLPQTEFTIHLFCKQTTPSLEGYSQETKCMGVDLKLSKLSTF